MSRAVVITGLLSVCLAAASALRAQPDEAQSESASQAPAAAETQESGPPAPNVELERLLGQVAERSGREFLIDKRASRRIYVGGPSLAEIDYPRLLSILRANDLAATETDDLVYVSPAAWKRQLPSRIVNEDDPEIPDDAWVTRVVNVPGDNAPRLVPILRPLMPQEAHLAAYPSEEEGGMSGLLIVDRYANVRRLTALVEALTR